ncbi:MAG: hypothetical protein HYU86_02940 [Chloroflexi bacterium]|nr:hypothetical protein [Chloroflexota bacterium]
MAEVTDRLKKIPGYQPGMPAHRMDDVTFMDELELMWGRKWGAQSELGELKLAIVHRPGEEELAEEVDAAPAFFWNYGSAITPFDLEKKQRQHDQFAAALRSEGVELIYANFPPTVRGIYSGIRGLAAPDPQIINGGAIIPRCAIAGKRGMEILWTKKLAELGCPILLTIHGSGIHEVRANTVWLDPKHVAIGCSVRSNLEGIRQVEPVYRDAGVEEIHIAYLPGFLYTKGRKTNAGAFHLDNVLGMVNEKLAVVVPAGLDYDTIAYLREKKIRLIEVPEEEAVNEAGNCLAIRPGVVVMAAGSPVTCAALRKEGCRVIEVDMSEMSTRGGGPVCYTGPAIREPGPYLDD